MQGGHHTRWACGVGWQEQSSGSALISMVEHRAWLSRRQHGHVALQGQLPTWSVKMEREMWRVASLARSRNVSPCASDGSAPCTQVYTSIHIYITLDSVKLPASAP